MNESQFWMMIEEMPDKDDPLVWLVQELSKKTEDEIADYEIQFQTAFNKSYTSNLWGAAYVIMGGCSDDSFDFFRGWLIAQGKKVFVETIENPEYLASYIPEENDEEEIIPELEEMISVGYNAFAIKKTGEMEWNDSLWEEFDTLVSTRANTPPFDEIELDWEDEDDLKDRFPILWERFGESSLG